MKMRRPLLLMLALLMAALVAPQAFAGDGGGFLIPVDSSVATEEGFEVEGGTTYTIRCLDGRTTTCTGTYDYCRGYCDGYCGGGQGSCS